MVYIHGFNVTLEQVGFGGKVLRFRGIRAQAESGRIGMLVIKWLFGRRAIAPRPQGFRPGNETPKIPFLLLYSGLLSTSPSLFLRADAGIFVALCLFLARSLRRTSFYAGIRPLKKNSRTRLDKYKT